MRGKSHTAMGHFLLERYLQDITETQKRAFLIGCVQPDRNPTTYLKGSIRSQWMRGHNYSNAGRYMTRLAVRLEQKRHFTLWDYYSMGKLIHYTMDAFTYAHNEHFPKKLREHRVYEVRLQRFFLEQVDSFRMPEEAWACSAADLIGAMHALYMEAPGSAARDTEYCVSTCCHLIAKLTGACTECQE